MDKFIFSVIPSISRHKLICTSEFGRDFLFYFFIPGISQELYTSKSTESYDL